MVRFHPRPPAFARPAGELRLASHFHRQPPRACHLAKAVRRSGEPRRRTPDRTLPALGAATLSTKNLRGIAKQWIADLATIDNGFLVSLGSRDRRLGAPIARFASVSVRSKRFVYLLRSHDGRPYMGLTSNVPARLGFHNAGMSPHTARHRPWELVVTIEFAAEEHAVRFEKYLKTGSGRAFAKRHFE